MRSTEEAYADALKSGAIQAWVDGKPFQIRNFNTRNTWNDYVPSKGTVPLFCDRDLEWRVKPTPKSRPWKPSEVPPLALFRHKSWDKSIWSAIIGVHFESIELSGFRGQYTYAEAFHNGEYSVDKGVTWQRCETVEGAA